MQLGLCVNKGGGVFTLKSLKLGKIKNEFLVIKVSLKVFVKKD